MLVDSAVMHFSVETNVTRYSKSDLYNLRETKAAKALPPCRFIPRIAQLDILRISPEQQQQQQQAEDPLKAFRSVLPNLSWQNWDPKNFDMLTNYQRSLFNQQSSFTSNRELIRNKLRSESGFMKLSYRKPIIDHQRTWWVLA